MSEPILPIQDRDSVGRGAARRLRRAGMVPGVVYGGARKTRSIVVSAKDLAANLKNESFHSSVVSLTRDDSKRPIKALLRAIQMHPTRAEPAHVDFQAVRADREISAAAPLRFINIETAPGVKLRHGIFTTIENEAQIHCLPKDLPEFIEIDVGELDVGKSVHLSEVTPPAGVRFDALGRGQDPALALISARRAEEVEEEKEAPEGEAAKTEEAASSSS